MALPATTQDTAPLPEGMEILPLAGTFAAEIRGVSLADPGPALPALHDALIRHKVICFRNQPITPEQHIALGQAFGAVTVHPFVPHLEGHPEILLLDNHADNPVFSTDVWHSDETFRTEPPMGSILHCIRIPDARGDTIWADMVAVYDGLSDKMRNFLSGLEAIHDFKPFRNKFNHLPAAERHAKLAEMEDELPNPTHPVIRTHPVTGDRALFVNEQFTLAIKGMKRGESDALLNYLYTLPKIPEYQFRFRWQPDSIVFWDNRPTQHYAANDYYPAHRTMQRITIKGDRPY